MLCRPKPVALRLIHAACVLGEAGVVFFSLAQELDWHLHGRGRWMARPVLQC